MPVGTKYLTSPLKRSLDLLGGMLCLIILIPVIVICFILLAIQEFPPAAISWYFSIASLAAGCILKNKNIDEIDHESAQFDSR